MLRSYSAIPNDLEVVSLAGMVAVYSSCWSEITEGNYYVTESQRPPGGMTWQAYDEHVRRYETEGWPRTHLETKRRVIRATRRKHTGNAWWFIHERGSADGPIKDWAVGHNIVGEVVGIYRP